MATQLNTSLLTLIEHAKTHGPLVINPTTRQVEYDDKNTINETIRPRDLTQLSSQPTIFISMTNLKKSQKAFRPGDPAGLDSDEIELYNQMKERAEEIHCKPESCDGHSPPRES